jgi:hypothetical protein
MTLKLDTYTIYARIFPAILSVVPLFVLWFFVTQDAEWNNLLKFIISLKFLSSVSISAVFLYFYAQFIRITSKYFERRYFVLRRGFPTTYFMLYADPTFSADYKDKFRERVRRVFKLEPLNAADEAAQPNEARIRLNEAFNHIRLKVGSGKLVLKHNIWYGFARNLIGGAVYSSIFCAANILIGWKFLDDPKLVIVSAILLVVHLLILLLHKFILVQNAEAYARQLISEFMTTGKLN